MIAERSLDSHVDVHIGLPNQEIRNVLGRCSLFASASDYEGFGLVAVEALSAGLMPVLNANTAYKDLASRHGEIRICDFADSDATAAAIEAAFDVILPTLSAIACPPCKLRPPTPGIRSPNIMSTSTARCWVATRP